MHFSAAPAPSALLFWYASHWSFEITICDLKECYGSNSNSIGKESRYEHFVLRGHRIILDQDLAQLYGVEVRHLNQQVKRNARRFPPEFVFRLSTKEAAFLRSQIVISNEGRGGRRYRPFAFTEHGAIMAATVLKSQRAIQMSIFVVRAFVRVRKILSANQLIIAKLSELERRIENHDSDIQQLIDAIRSLMVPAPANRRKIGFELLGNVHATSRVRIAV